MVIENGSCRIDAPDDSSLVFRGSGVTEALVSAGDAEFPEVIDAPDDPTPPEAFQHKVGVDYVICFERAYYRTEIASGVRTIMFRNFGYQGVAYLAPLRVIPKIGFDEHVHKIR